MSSVLAHRIVLTEDEQRTVLGVAHTLAGDGKVELLRVLNETSLAAQELPRRIRAELRQFKTNAPYHLLCVSQSFTGEIPSTPKEHRPAGMAETAYWFDIIHLMYASLLGEPFGWSSIQNGYIINDVMPLPERESTVASYGSAVPFDLHTEDAFHICAGEYLGLMCVRNPTGANTTFSTVTAADLSPSSVAVLREPRYVVGANVAQEVGQVADMMPVFFGHRQHPHFRVNLNTMSTYPGDRDAAAAFQELTEALRRNTIEIAFRPGECWFIDNYRTAHGRGRFQPQYDGRDRWLRRLYITEALRRSASLRDWPDGRIVNPLRAHSFSHV